MPKEKPIKEAMENGLKVERVVVCESEKRRRVKNVQPILLLLKCSPKKTNNFYLLEFKRVLFLEYANFMFII